MSKNLLILIIIGTVCISIIAGCGVKTVGQEKVDLEMEKTKNNLNTGTPSEELDKNSFKGDSSNIEEQNIDKDDQELSKTKQGETSDKKSNPFLNANNNDLLKKPLTNFITNGSLDDVLFDFDKYSLGEMANEILIKNAQWLKKRPELKIQLAGHCDERGTNNYNIALGERRALYVKRKLVSLGITKNRLKTVSYGEEKPACLQGAEKCWSKNRRVQFLISAE